MRWGVKGPNLLLNDSLLRGRTTAGGVNHPVPGGMIETAENLRRDYAIGRGEQDEYAVRSHQRAAAAADDGRFAEEIIPVTISNPQGRRGGRQGRAHPPGQQPRETLDPENRSSVVTTPARP